jgi:uncharacterized protein
MSQPTNADPPLVTRVEPVAPAKPPPGLLESLLWCVAFWVVLLASTLLAAGLVLTGYALGTDDPGQFFLDQFHGFGAALAPAVPGQPPPPPMPVAFGNALAYGMLAGQVGTLVLALFVARYRVGRDWKRQLGIGPPAVTHLFLVALVVPGFIVLAQGVQETFAYLTGVTTPQTEVLLRGTLQGVPWAVTLGAVALGPGIVEELWCRGFLGRGLCARYGLAWGIVLTSVIFSALHLSLAQCFVFVLMGAYLHFVYLASRSIWVPVLLHLLNNGLVTISLLHTDLYAVWVAFEENRHGYRRVIELAALGLMVFASVALWTSRARVIAKPGRPAWEPEYSGVSLPPEDAAELSYGAISSAAVVLALASFAVLAYLFRQLVA